MTEYMVRKLDGFLPHSNELTFLKVPSRRGSRGNVVFLAFDVGQQEPSFVVKIARDGRASNDLVREARILVTLEKIGRNCEEVRDTVPRLVHFDPNEGFLVETCLNGKKLRGEYDNITDLCVPKVQHLLNNVSLWLDEFHQSSSDITDVLQETAGTRAQMSLVRAIYEEKFEEIERSEYLCSLFEQNLSEIPDPSVVCHGDFNPYNILIADRRVSGVYDWEDWLLGHPLLDRFHCVTVMIGHLPYKDIQQFPDRVARFLRSDSIHSGPRRVVNRFVTDPAEKWGYNIDYVNHYYAVYLFEMMEKEIKRADSAAMLMWRKLLVHYLKRLERNQPGLILG